MRRNVERIILIKICNFHSRNNWKPQIVGDNPYPPPAPPKRGVVESSDFQTFKEPNEKEQF